MDAVRRAAWFKSTVVLTLCVGGAAGIIAMADGRVELLNQVLLSLGVLFAFGVAATRTIAGRHKDISTLVLVFWGLSFGFWAAQWMTAVGLGLSLAASDGHIPADTVDLLHLPITIASAGLATASLLYVGTGCGRVAGHAVFASLAAAVTPLAPVMQQYAIQAGGIAFHAIVCGSLCVWAVRQAVETAGVGCGKCGADLRGLASPVCPACGAQLTARPQPTERPAVAALPPTLVTDSRLRF